MSFWAEILIWTLGTLILEPPLLWLFNKLAKKKHNLEPIKVDPNNFIIKQSKDMRGMAWVLGLFLGIPTLACLIAFPFIYENNGMSKTDVMILAAILTFMLLVIIALMYRVIVFKAEIRNDKFIVYTFLRIRKFEIAELTTKLKKQGHFEAFLVYHKDRKIFGATHAMPNYEIAKKRLGVVETF